MILNILNSQSFGDIIFVQTIFLSFILYRLFYHLVFKKTYFSSFISINNHYSMALMHNMNTLTVLAFITHSCNE